MATFKIPNQGQVRQLNINDTSGELWSSFNVDLHTEPGKIKLARPLKREANASDISNGLVSGFGAINDIPYAVTSSNLYRTTIAGTWELADSTVSNCSDMTTFNGQLVMVTDGDLDAYDGSTFTSNWWTARGNTALPSQSPSVVQPITIETVRIGTETLVATAGSTIYAYTGGISGSPVANTQVDIDDQQIAICVKSGIRKVFIGTFTRDAEEAYVYEWDGASTNYTQAYPVGAKAVLAMTLVDDVPMIITERGEIKLFNNVGFTTVAQLPFATKPLFGNSTFTNTHPRS